MRDAITLHKHEQWVDRRVALKELKYSGVEKWIGKSPFAQDRSSSYGNKLISTAMQLRSNV